MARWTFRAAWLALVGACALSKSGLAQPSYPLPTSPAAYVDSQRRQAEAAWFTAGESAAAAPAHALSPGMPPIKPPSRPPAGAQAANEYTPYHGPTAASSFQPPPLAPYAGGVPSPAPGPAPPVIPYSAPPGPIGEWTKLQDEPRTANLPSAPTMTPEFGRPAVHPREPLSPQRAVLGPAGPTSTAPAPSQSRAPGELFQAGQVMAVVGDEPILYGDMMGSVNMWIEANKAKIPPGREDEFRKRLTEQALEAEIQNKLLYLNFVRTVREKGAGPEKITEIHNKVFDGFDEKRLPELMEKAGVASPVDLDAKMREQGTSLMKHKRQFAEKVMGQEGLKGSDKINFEPVITHGQMLDYYYAHVEDYEFPAKAKWEHLMARFSKFRNKAEAYEAIRAMGTEVYLGGAPLWAVAKRSSHGVTADDGGQFDSTSQGSLKSKVLDEAVFTLPLNQLSPILEDEDGFHIVRVLERRDAGRTSFESAQGEIKEKLKKEHVDKQIADFLADLRSGTPVWTVFDEEKKQRRQEEANRGSSFGKTR